MITAPVLDTDLLDPKRRAARARLRYVQDVTLRDNHVEIEGAKVQFRFRGKSGKFHQVQFRDRRLAKIVKQCQDIFAVCGAVKFRPTRWLSKYEQAMLHLLRRLDGS